MAAVLGRDSKHCGNQPDFVLFCFVFKDDPMIQEITPDGSGRRSNPSEIDLEPIP